MKKAIRMRVFPDKHEAYKKRHDELWPELQEVLKTHGCTKYNIWLDEETHYLFAYLEIEDEELFTKIADMTINRKWWDFMADIMETNADNSPVSIDLTQVFELED
ncbi:L-rhamnose mutarotase [Lactococcus lactis]|uniref:L-rhamnose mutarotase n=1 Tax=Lactococcus lactis subsp. lactis TaxID=1360 RepID=A0A2N5WFZ1_LACLL|nr:L-rhamnose mutarotase [Lactococcus lactis]PLW61150.1 L-rhamnose mutarotase [Lactococcus lactis subsp. lactis]